MKIDAIYAFYLESSCNKNLAIRKVFVFSDSALQHPLGQKLFHLKGRFALHGFVKVVTWICQSCHMYLSPFAKQIQAEICPSY